MKRKLVAALLSVAMVASITPVSALSPVASVEAADTALLTTADAIEAQIAKLVTANGVFNGQAADTVYYTTAYADAIKLARDSYDSLQSIIGQAGQVDNYATLQKVEAVYKEAYTDKITNVEKLISEVPSSLSTAEDVAKVATAQTAYSGLNVVAGTSSNGLGYASANLRAGVSKESADKLTAANTAKNVVTRINSLGTVTNENYADADSNPVKNINDVKAGYDALTSAAKAMVGNISKLEKQLALIQEYKDQVTAYDTAVKKTITDNATRPTANTVKATETDIAAAEKNVEDLASKKATLSATQVSTVTTDGYVNAYKTNIKNAKSALAVIEQIAKIPSAVSAKDKVTVSAADTAYTRLNANAKKLVNEADVKKLEDAKLKIAQIALDDAAVKSDVLAVMNEILSRGELTSADKADVDNAVNIYVAYYGRINVANADKDLEAARAALYEKQQQVNQLVGKDEAAAAQKIVDQIDALPLAANVKSSDKDAYDAAQKAYDSATKAVQNLAATGQVKTAKENVTENASVKLTAVKVAVGKALKADVVTSLKALINELNVNGSLADKDKYDEIEKLFATDLSAYDAEIKTSDVGTDLYKKYADAKKKYDALVAAEEDANGKVTAQSVIELINKIPALKVDGTDTEADIQAVEDAIKAAEDAYANLNSDGKAHVTNYDNIAAAKDKVATAKVYPLSKDIKTVYGYDITAATDATKLTEGQVKFIEDANKVYTVTKTDTSDYALLRKLNTNQELSAFDIAVAKAKAYRDDQAAKVSELSSKVSAKKEADINAMTLANRSDFAAIIKNYESLGEQAKEDFAKTKAYETYQKIAAKYNSFDLANSTIKVEAESVVYNGDAQQVSVTVTDSLGNVVNPSAYKVTYRDNTNVGTATVKVTGNDENYTGINTTTFEITVADIKDATVTPANKTYTGKALTTSIKVVANGDVLVEGTDYEVTSYENNTNVGTATVTITGKGNYTGTTTGNFIVKPGKVNLTKVTAGTKKATAKYTGKTGASYKVVYAVKGTTKYKAVYTKNLTKTISGLKSGTTYKVKVLAYYKDASGKAYYTGYSNMRTVKVK